MLWHDNFDAYLFHLVFLVTFGHLTVFGGYHFFPILFFLKDLPYLNQDLVIRNTNLPFDILLIRIKLYDITYHVR